jgi:hypothetical protein
MKWGHANGMGRDNNVPEGCLFDIMGLPEKTLRQVLPKVSVRMVSRLITAYPRAVGRTLLNAMAQCVSPFTLEFLRDEIHSNQFPSMYQICEAEKEFLKTLKDEQLLPESKAA